MPHDKQFPAENWERLVSEDRQRFQNIDLFLKEAQPADSEVWLDFGCGPGYFTLPLARRVQKVYALDVSPEMLRVCQTRVKEAGLTNVEFLQIEGARITLPDSSAHGVLMANVFHELDQPKTVLQEVQRVLAPDGRVVLIDWKAVEMEQGPPLDHRIPEERAIQTFQEQGFKLQKRQDIYEYHYFLIFTK